MKKLMVLALVLGIGSFASAGLVFSFNGTPAVSGAEILSTGILNMTLSLDAPSTTYTIEIDTTGDLTLDTTGATWAAMLFGNGPIAAATTETHLRLSGDNFMTALAAGTNLFDGIKVNGLDGQVLVNGLGATPNQAFTVVPEPMTLGLLGLGGLFLRRRK